MPPPPEQHDPFNTKRPVVYRLRGWQWLVFYPLAALLWVYLRSLRIRCLPEERRQLQETPSPRLAITWHNRSLVIPEVLRVLMDPPRFACLVSPSRAAAWEAAFFELLGFPVVRGSTTRRSVQAGIELLRTLREGNDSGLTPDGPSGPLYSFKEGAASLARKTGVPLLILVPNCPAALRLRTWDRHLVPLPFARVTVRLRLIPPDDPLWDNDSRTIAQSLRAICLGLTEDPPGLAGTD